MQLVVKQVRDLEQFTYCSERHSLAGAGFLRSKRVPAATSQRNTLLSVSCPKINPQVEPPRFSEILLAQPENTD
jgi:hypothetical protein